MTLYRNVQEALYLEVRRLMDSGAVVESRNGATREMTGHVIRLLRPQERFHALPHRRANPVAQVAETLWVLGGRNDIEWLSYYLPRAGDFSDDGETWRAGYGPRLRGFAYSPIDARPGVDQVAEVVQLLRNDPTTRRAVISIFDPSEDFCESKDIPCNNWLHFLARDGILDLHIATRSNDVIWGWSGINAFEWSVLHELVARSAGMDIGMVSFFIGSFHIYEQHWSRARRIIREATHTPSLYNERVYPTPIKSHLAEFDRQLTQVFNLEGLYRTRGYTYKPAMERAESLTDPFLQQSVRLLRLSIARKQGATQPQLCDLISQLTDDFRVVAEEWLERNPSTYVENVTPPVKSEREYPDPNDQPPELTYDMVLASLVGLQTSKGAVYGDSWRKWGEQMSIIPNIARKYDRLLFTKESKAETPDESQMDTYADLAVYSWLYHSWLNPGWGGEPAELPPFHETIRRNQQRWSETLEWPDTVDQSWGRLHTAFTNLMDTVRCNGDPLLKSGYAAEIGRQASWSLYLIGRQNPAAYEQWAKQWE